MPQLAMRSRILSFVLLAFLGSVAAPVAAQAAVIGPDGKLVAFRHIQSGAGYCRCSPLEAHLGLGKTPAAGYRVEVNFPATQTRVVREQVKPGQRIVVKEAEDKNGHKKHEKTQKGNQK